MTARHLPGHPSGRVTTVRRSRGACVLDEPADPVDRRANGVRRPDRDVFGLLFPQGLGVIVAGIAVGLPLAFAVAPLLAGLLYGVSSLSIETFAGAALVLLLVGLAASFLPAYRAVRIDPMHALRHD